MSKYVIQDTTLQGIADAIRTKTGKTAKILVENLATEIGGISVGGKLIEKSVTSNGTYNASSDGAYGYSKVVVHVPIIGGSGGADLTEIDTLIGEGV